MKQIALDYTEDFLCLAGTCPDTCCKDWEIVLSPEDVARYRALPGALGDRVRAAMTQTEDGETMWRLVDGHCALLREDGLCPIQCAWGEAALCRTCRTHPRFWEEYGGTQELTLALSCPGAAQLLLAHEGPLRPVSSETCDPVTPNSLDPARYLALCRARQTAFSLVQTQDPLLPLSMRMALLLLFAQRMQLLLDERRESDTEALCRKFEHMPARQLARARRLMQPEGDFFPGWAVLQNMEHLTARFPALLSRAVREEPSAAFDARFAQQAENLLVYFLFRYFLKAVNDGQLLPRVESCVFHLLALRYLCGAAGAQTVAALQPPVSLYCKEVEHSEDNLRLLHRAFARRTLPLRWLFSVLRP